MQVSNANPAASERDRKMKTLTSYAFAAWDMSLYLNTHPTDKQALQMHADLVEKAREAREAYVQEFGPLSSSDCVSTERWCWIDDPWPWEAE